ncbi:MAG TPA: hypothetical protein VKU41_01535, partial [Polyangiaceae bacterium]|nr:hypothetical protein [Polyangiaceae bacterium]
MDIRVAAAPDAEAVERLLRMQFDEHDIVLDAGALRDAVRGALGEPSRGTFLLARRSPQARAKREFGRHTRTSPQARAKREFGRHTRTSPQARAKREFGRHR